MRSWDRASVAINKKFFFTFNCLYNRDLHLNLINITQLSIKGRNVFNKANIDERVKNSKFKRTDVFNKRLVTKTADQLKGNAKTIKSNREHA